LNRWMFLGRSPLPTVGGLWCEENCMQFQQVKASDLCGIIVGMCKLHPWLWAYWIYIGLKNALWQKSVSMPTLWHGPCRQFHRQPTFKESFYILLLFGFCPSQLTDEVYSLYLNQLPASGWFADSHNKGCKTSSQLLNQERINFSVIWWV